MNTDFTLKSVVDFLESSGFHVREAREIEREEIVDPLIPGGKKPVREIEAIRLEIAPKTREDRVFYQTVEVMGRRDNRRDFSKEKEEKQ
jgi:hypothetical protein